MVDLNKNLRFHDIPRFHSTWDDHDLKAAEDLLRSRSLAAVGGDPDGQFCSWRLVVVNNV